VYRRFTIALLGGLLLCTTAQAKSQGNCGSNCAECHTLTPDEAKAILKEVGEVKNVKISPVKGLWEVTLEKDGRQAVAYMDFAKKNIIAGRVFPLTPGKMGAQESTQTGSAVIKTASIPLEGSIIMGNPKGTKKLFLFTDPDCPFCRKMHAELVKLEQSEPDVAIYVLPYPRPNNPDSYDKSRAIVAGKSRPLLDRAFSGKEVLLRTGASEGRKELDDIVHFARYNGITATPSLVLANGTVLTGFRDAESLGKLLNSRQGLAVATK
jgi:thiol:disulfide interchange protein DsbC